MSLTELSEFLGGVQRLYDAGLLSDRQTLAHFVDAVDELRRAHGMTDAQLLAFHHQSCWDWSCVSRQRVKALAGILAKARQGVTRH